MARRESQKRPLNKSSAIVIFTEGKSEKLYFEKLNQKYKAKIQVKISQETRQGLDLVEEAEKLLSNQRNKKFQAIKVEKVYIIFDKDDLKIEDLQKAKQKADKLAYTIGLSNESFELWFLLHFESVDSKLVRNQLKKRLTSNLQRTYHKTDDKMITDLVDRIEIALKHAEKFDKNLNISQNPYTNIGWIIKEIYGL